MKKVLLKISGELFGEADLVTAKSLAKQIGELRQSVQLGVVVGAGNFFRGARSSQAKHLSRGSADLVGMLGTTMNCVMLQDLLDQEGISSDILCALHLPSVGAPISQHRISEAFKAGKIIIFAGGSGNPFMTTDTTAVMRALQLGADELWKATNVDRLYDKDPALYTDAQAIASCSHAEAVARKLAIMDLTALTMAEQHRLPIRIFKASAPRSLACAAGDAQYGSVIITE